MSKKSFVRTFSMVFAGAFSVNFIYHKYCMKKYNNMSDGSYYSWDFGDVYYEKCGSGEPLLLIHSLSPERSSSEWSYISSFLSEKYTVYTVDLPGCGRSDKDIDKYTDYFYSSFLKSFVKNVIGSKCIAVASEYSSRIPIIASHFDNTLFSKVVLLNPPELIHSTYSDTIRYLYSKAVSLPVLGYLLYDIRYCGVTLRNIYGFHYFSDPNHADSSFIEKCVFDAQVSGGRGKYLYESMLSGILGHKIPAEIFQTSVPVSVVRYSHSRKNRAFFNMNMDAHEFLFSDNSLLPQIEDPKGLSIYLYNAIFS